MNPKIIVLEKRKIYLPTWQQVFAKVSCVLVVDDEIQSYRGNPRVDAEIMRSLFAHERYGGKSIVGESQILSSKGDEIATPWIITTPPFPAHLQKIPQRVDGANAVIVKDNEMPIERETYEVFSKIFLKIKAFNSSAEVSRINTVFFGAKFLNIPRLEPRLEITAIKEAYETVFFT